MKTSGWQRFQSIVHDRLESLKDRNLLRELSPTRPEWDSPLINNKIDLTHNDYLGLRSSRDFQRRAIARLDSLPAGAGGSRLLGGDHPIFSPLEQAFALFKGSESALYMGSGYAANEAVSSIFDSAEFKVFSDQLNHASIIDGIRMGVAKGGKKEIYPHLGYDALEELLKKSDASVNVIYTESVFSMDGDLADLSRLSDLAAIYNGILVIDEAHAIGVLGPLGRGAVAESQLDCHTCITIDTCGKALGVSGAFISGPRWFRDLLINQARPFIYSTAPSPWIAAALDESIEFIQKMDSQRDLLQKRATLLRLELAALGFNCGLSSTQIIPVLAGEELKALDWAQKLSENGVAIKAIRPPTVPENTSRLRLSLNVLVDDKMLREIIAAFRELI